ncbi:MAG TPA: FkbM family methyltransferase [Puia sp.]|nr:FkbM family methyltransferase [Puia sp.]
MCNDFVGGIILAFFRKTVPDIRWPGFRFYLRESGTSRKNVASIFWGFYEAAEIRLIEKYFEGNTDIVELGGSLGVVSAHIMSKLRPGKKFIAVEANPHLVNNLLLNVERFKKNGTHFGIRNNAIQYFVEQARFHISADTTGSRVGLATPDNLHGVSIPATTLSQIVNQELLDNFSLVCDIEGSEIEVILLDAGALSKCANLFIELHEVEYNNVRYTPDEMLARLVGDHGFKALARQGNAVYLTK